MDRRSGLRVQLATYNAGQMFDGSGVPELQEWLIPTVSESRRSGYATTDGAAATTAMSLGPREAPDIYAVAIQECAPLHKALAGMHTQAVDQLDVAIRRTVRLHQSVVRDDRMYDPLELGGGPENYAKMAEICHGGLILFVYARERPPQRTQGRQLSAAHRIKEVRTSFVGTGIGMVMGNKGAVGARVVLSSAVPGGPDEVCTFVCAHLAAHDHNVQRRHAEWRAVCERLVFDPMSVQVLPPLQDPLSQEKPATFDVIDDHEYSLYDTHHLFVLGDLNYRLATGVEGVSPAGRHTAPGTFPPITRGDVLQVARTFESQRWASLAPYDQLVRERFAPTPRTMHHLHVPDMGVYHIPPTYKYKARGEMEQLSTKRLPGWPDRLLWGSSDASAGNQAMQCELYRSIMRYTYSDHKPVTAIVQLPPHIHPLSDHMRAPFRLSPQWRTWRSVGLIADRVVGLVWSGLLFFGHGYLVLAVMELALLCVVGWYYVHGQLVWPL